MFAFAIWDRVAGKLLIARDHLGQKPMFWAQDGERIYFASEIKAILAPPRAAGRGPPALDEYLTLRIIARRASMFAGVRKLPPAHLLEVTDGRTQSAVVEPPLRAQAGADRSGPLERLEHEIEEAVRFTLVSDVPVGAFLSGGIDSGLVVAAMRAATSEPFHTFSGGVPSGQFDGCRRPRGRPAIRHHPSRLHDRRRSCSASCRHWCTISTNRRTRSAPACTGSRQLARQHVKVTLGGDGGDELFGGYDRYYGNRLRALLCRCCPSWCGIRLCAVSSTSCPTASGTRHGHRVRWLDELARVEDGRRYARSLSYCVFRPHPPRAALHRRLPLPARRLRSRAGGHLLARRRQRETGAGPDAAGRQCGAPAEPLGDDPRPHEHGAWARGRSPFLDHKLAEFAATLPVQLKIRGRSRVLQMRLAARYIPPEVLRRPKQGFNSPLPYMLSDRPIAACSRACCRTRASSAGDILGAMQSGSCWTSTLPAPLTMAIVFGCWSMPRSGIA